MLVFAGCSKVCRWWFYRHDEHIKEKKVTTFYWFNDIFEVKKVKV
ncbi:MAG: hypothetical protein ACRCW0_08945 [Clostridium sp.]